MRTAVKCRQKAPAAGKVRLFEGWSIAAYRKRREKKQLPARGREPADIR
jgi:hypothetical protein